MEAQDYDSSEQGQERRRVQRWTPEEHAKLESLVRAAWPNVKWPQIANALATGRTGKQCRERWMNARPENKKGSWTYEEERLIAKLHAEMGPAWSKISKRLTARTENDTKNHWNALLRCKTLDSRTDSLLGIYARLVRDGAEACMATFEEALHQYHEHNGPATDTLPSSSPVAPSPEADSSCMETSPLVCNAAQLSELITACAALAAQVPSLPTPVAEPMSAPAPLASEPAACLANVPRVSCEASPTKPVACLESHSSAVSTSPAPRVSASSGSDQMRAMDLVPQADTLEMALVRTRQSALLRLTTAGGLPAHPANPITAASTSSISSSSMGSALTADAMMLAGNCPTLSGLPQPLAATVELSDIAGWTSDVRCFQEAMGRKAAVKRCFSTIGEYANASAPRVHKMVKRQATCPSGAMLQQEDGLYGTQHLCTALPVPHSLGSKTPFAGEQQYSPSMENNLHHRNVFRPSPMACPQGHMEQHSAAAYYSTGAMTMGPAPTTTTTSSLGGGMDQFALRPVSAPTPQMDQDVDLQQMYNDLVGGAMDSMEEPTGLAMMPVMPPQQQQRMAWCPPAAPLTPQQQCLPVPQYLAAPHMALHMPGMPFQQHSLAGVHMLQV